MAIEGQLINYDNNLENENDDEEKEETRAALNNKES